MGRGLVESSDVRSDVFTEGFNSSLGNTGSKEDPTKEHVPYAFFPQATGPGIGYKLPFFPYFDVSRPPPTSTFSVKATYQARLLEISPSLSQELSQEAELIKEIRRTLLDAQGVKFYER